MPAANDGAEFMFTKRDTSAIAADDLLGDFAKLIPGLDVGFHDGSGARRRAGAGAGGPKRPRGHRIPEDPLTPAPRGAGAAGRGHPGGDRGTARRHRQGAPPARHADPFALTPHERAARRLNKAIATPTSAPASSGGRYEKAGGDLTLGDLKALTARAKATTAGAERHQREVLRDQIAEGPPSPARRSLRRRGAAPDRRHRRKLP